jgi:hypothetical protein
MAEPKFNIGDRVRYLVKANYISKGMKVDLYDAVKILGFYKPPELDPQELEELDPQELQDQQKQQNKKYYETDRGVKEVEKIDLTGEKIGENEVIIRHEYKRTNRRNRTRKNRTRKNRTRKL